MKAWLAWMALAAGLSFGQDPRAVMEAQIQKQRESLAAMSASVELQKASIRRQAATNREDSFFFVPMSAPASSPEPAAAEVATTDDCDPMSHEEVAPIVARNAETTGLSPVLLKAVIAQESAFKPCAVSRAGARGLMQLMPSTARQLGVTDVLDPEQNIEAGSRYLKELMKRYGGNVILALAAYNAGPGRVDAAGGVPPILETTRYVDRVLSRTMGQLPLE